MTHYESYDRVTHRYESPGSGLLREEAYIKDRDGPWI